MVQTPVKARNTRVTAAWIVFFMDSVFSLTVHVFGAINWARAKVPQAHSVHPMYCILQGIQLEQPGRVAQSVGHLTRKSGVLGSIPGLATYFRFSFRFFKKGSCQLLGKVCARSRLTA